RLLVVPRLVSAARLHRRDDVHQAGVFATSFQHLRHDRFTFLCHAFELTTDARLKYPELAFSGPKKSGKTAFAAMILLYVVRILGGRYAEGFAAANDYEQAQGRVFQAAARIVEASPLLLRRLRGVRRTQPLPVVFKNCTIVARYLDPAHYLVR